MPGFGFGGSAPTGRIVMPVPPVSWCGVDKLLQYDAFGYHGIVCECQWDVSHGLPLALSRIAADHVFCTMVLPCDLVWS